MTRTIAVVYAPGDRVQVPGRKMSGRVYAVTATQSTAIYSVAFDDRSCCDYFADELEPLVVDGQEVAP